MTADAFERDVPQLVTFFIPLPEPLNVAQQMTVTFEADDEHDIVSLRIWQCETSLVHLAEQLRLADEVARRVVGSAVQQPRPPSPLLDGISGTVVEAVAVVDDPTDLTSAFDRCLARIAQLAVAFGLGSRQAVAPVTRERLPLLILYALRRGDSAFDADTVISAFWLHANEVRRHVPAEARSESQVMHFLAEQNLGGPRIAYMRLSADAHRAFERDGDMRAAVISRAAACEVLLDGLLLAMLWDEGREPVDAAKVMDGGLMSRVKKHYAGRLGGSWVIDGSGAVAAWHRDVAAVRNRCVHAGYTPTIEEAKVAARAESALVATIKNRLQARKAKFPGAGMVFGTSGRDDAERHATISRFILWQHEVNRHRDVDT